MFSVPIIHIFESFNSARLIRFFKDFGIEIFYDTKNSGRLDIISKQAGENGRIFNIFIDQITMCKTEDILNIDNIDMLITFKEGVELTEKQWYSIKNAIENGLEMHHEYDNKKKRISNFSSGSTKDDIEAGLEILRSGICKQTLVYENGSKEIGPDQPKLEGGYDYKTKYIEKLDCKIYEVKRPGTLKPFTVAVYEWKTKGDQYFFTDIYGSREWDMNRLECRFDYTFLKELWKNLGLPGEFNMDLVRERVQRCYPTEMLNGNPPEGEPIVYRKSLEDVASRIENRI